ncbi:hypothetical protein GCM10007874_54220 [Labrys miyagiensis]|uniref:Uncharacterized protein n=1 Tax=Labrys miyagiensis TaxID=346912 RepID=A0ABQ6CQH0_9HYPH|nr:hypothetical protein GCM10007874_54220 [Labrys miyagiensis]
MYMSEPDETRNGREDLMPLGRVLDGFSSIHDRHGEVEIRGAHGARKSDGKDSDNDQADKDDVRRKKVRGGDDHVAKAARLPTRMANVTTPRRSKTSRHRPARLPALAFRKFPTPD